MDTRLSLVPWLWDSDLKRGVGPMWTLCQPPSSEDEHLSVWAIDLHDHVEYLLVHATRGNGNDGGEITLTPSYGPRYDLVAEQMTPRVRKGKKYQVSEDTWR